MLNLSVLLDFKFQKVLDSNVFGLIKYSNTETILQKIRTLFIWNNAKSESLNFCFLTLLKTFEVKTRTKMVCLSLIKTNNSFKVSINGHEDKSVREKLNPI